VHRAFFDKYLRDQPAPLLNGPSPDYPQDNNSNSELRKLARQIAEQLA
jgi:hypothetical protein